MNKHIELVRKWLNDHDSVSQEDLDLSNIIATDEWLALRISCSEYSTNYQEGITSLDVVRSSATACCVAGATGAAAEANREISDTRNVVRYWLKKYEEALKWQN